MKIGRRNQTIIQQTHDIVNFASFICWRNGLFFTIKKIFHVRQSEKYATHIYLRFDVATVDAIVRKQRRRRLAQLFFYGRYYYLKRTHPPILRQIWSELFR